MRRKHFGFWIESQIQNLKSFAASRGGRDHERSPSRISFYQITHCVRAIAGVRLNHNSDTHRYPISGARERWHCARSGVARNSCAIQITAPPGSIEPSVTAERRNSLSSGDCIQPGPTRDGREATSQEGGKTQSRKEAGRAQTQPAQNNKAFGTQASSGANDPHRGPFKGRQESEDASHD